MVVVLAGGVGAARFLRGVVRVVPPEEVCVISNTGDDIRIYGAHVSPDIDTVIYTLAGAVDPERGWGLAGDTHTVMEALRALGEDPWFTLGDRDLAVGLARAEWLDAGIPLSEATTRLARSYGVAVRILPMTDAPVATRVRIEPAPGEPGADASSGAPGGGPAAGPREVHFQEYWVRRRARDRVLGVRLEGAAEACAAPGVLEAIDEADAVLVAPSNPVVSIGTVLAINGVREAIRATPAPVVGVSPIIGGAVVRGMADRLLPAVGAEVSALGVARLYADFLDGFVIDEADEALAGSVARLGMAVEATRTLMHTPDDAAALAKAALALAARLR